MSVALQQRLFTVDEYHRMGEAGIFSEDDRVELIEGAIVAMTPVGPPHAGNVNRLTQLFVLRLGNKAVVAVQNPVRLDRFSEPQPDLAVLRPRDDFFSQSQPGPEDVFWIVETGDSSVASDREVKAPLYAKAGIPEYWLIDLPNKTVEVHRNPVGGRYQSVEKLGKGDSIRPLAMPDAVFGVSDLLG